MPRSEIAAVGVALAPVRFGGMCHVAARCCWCCYLCLALCKMVGSNSHVVDVSLLIWMHGIFSSLAWSFVFLRMSDQLNSRELNGHTFWKIGCFVVLGSCFLQKIWHFGAVFAHLPTESWGGTSMLLPTAMPSCGRYAVHRIGSYFFFHPDLGRHLIQFDQHVFFKWVETPT